MIFQDDTEIFVRLIDKDFFFLYYILINTYMHGSIGGVKWINYLKLWVISPGYGSLTC